MVDNKPVHTISYGAIRLSVWLNSTATGFLYNIVPTRSYRKDDAWRESSSFGELDLPVLAKAILDAHTWIQMHKASEASATCIATLPDGSDSVV